MSSAHCSKTDLHVLIIGAGITGLLLAQGLQRAGIRFSIFEREPADYLSSRDWTIGIHWSIPMLKKLLPPDLYARLPEAYADPCHPDPDIAETLTLYDGQTGEEIKDIKSTGMIRIDRNRMRRLCKTGLHVQYEKALGDLSYGADGNGVTAQFLDGTAVTGDILIGSDGARSVVREQLLGTEKAMLKPAAAIIMMTKVNFHDAKKALHARTGNPIMKMAFHPSTGKMILVGIQNVLDENEPRTWSFVLGGAFKGKTEDYPDDKTRLAAWREAAVPFCEPYRSLVSWIPDGNHISVSATNYWIPTPWSNQDGRVTLMGDAAHPMTPIRGQGLNNCIADIANFVNAVAELSDKAGLPELVTNYDKELVTRGREEVEASVKNFEMILDFAKLRQTSLVTEGLTRNTASRA